MHVFSSLSCIRFPLLVKHARRHVKQYSRGKRVKGVGSSVPHQNLVVRCQVKEKMQYVGKFAVSQGVKELSPDISAARRVSSVCLEAMLPVQALALSAALCIQ